MLYPNKMDNLLKIFGLVFSVTVIVSTSQLPSDFKRCKSEDIFCLKESFQDAIPKVKNGIPELGVPSLDPLLISNMSIQGGEIIQLIQNYKDVEVFGFSESEITDLNFDLEKRKLVIHSNLPSLQVNATYSVRGKVLIFEVFGNGRCMLLLEGVSYTLTIDLETYTKDGQEYLRGIKSDFPVEASHLTYIFANLFDGNKLLGDNINKVLNDNWKDIWEEVGKGYTIVVGEYLMNLMNKLFEKIPMSELFVQ